MSAQGQVAFLLSCVSRKDAVWVRETQALGADNCVLEDPTCRGKSGLPSAQHSLPLNNPLPLWSDSLIAPSSHLE